MIRVLHYGLDSKLGGIETYLYKLYTNIDRNKYKFDFLVIGDEEPCWYKEFTDMGSEFYKVTPRSKNPIKNKKEIIELFKKEKFDIVHCHLNTLSYITPAQIAIESNIPVIVHSRNAGAVKSKISNLMHKINSKVLDKDKIVKLAVSDLAGEWLFGKNQNYTVINNGLDTEKYKFNIESRNRIRNDLKLKDNDLVIIHLGAMRQQKNHMFLLDIFNEFLKTNKNSKLLLVGDGNLKESVFNKAKELDILNNVVFAGNRNDIPDILCAGDIFLFPSFFEGFPNAVLEAQTSGLPCLISSSITKEVMINKNCYNMDLRDDVEKWCSKLKSITLNSKREEASEYIRKQGYSVKDEVKKINDIYEQLCNK